ncbi:hypothetical protein HGRIS_005103 [Hohenbuehelia grisea]|uniref:Fungal-type protein kinase domain-containing protein n=1 Tax=Hohenbuehelia grisea TaxID=104357 RepID=A0ABR3JEP1_9AGAR
MADDMRGRFIGPMPIELFFEQFMSVPELPQPKALDRAWKRIPKRLKVENQLYDLLGSLINKDNDICPEFKFVNTSAHSDPNMADTQNNIRPDFMIYPRTVDTSKHPTQFDFAELFGEIKKQRSFDAFAPSIIAKAPSAGPGFTSTPPLLVQTPQESMNSSILQTPLEPMTLDRRKTRGQASSYAAEFMDRQHRTHLFSVLLAHPWARFMRWDRSGAIATEEFNYLEDPQRFVEFFCRFSRMDNSQRGWDPTVESVSPTESELARQLLKPWAPKVERPIVKFGVPAQESTTRWFIGWGSVCSAHSPTGRATRGYPVFECGTTTVMFLKDAWRPANLNLIAEPLALALLNKAGCRRVPTLICGGDLVNQQTQNDKYADSPWNRNQVVTQTYVRAFIHHRFIIKEVGHPLFNFNSPREMLQVLDDAMEGHQDAYEKCKLLHRDVSASNIIILDPSNTGGERRGLLIDWDLAKSVEELDKPPRLPERTGTWHFISSFLLQYPGKKHELHDDLESFLWVGLYVAMRYIPHNLQQTLRVNMGLIFESNTGVDLEGYSKGGSHKTLTVISKTLIQGLEFNGVAALTEWLNPAIGLFRGWILKLLTASTNLPLNPKRAELFAELNAADYGLHSHAGFREVNRLALERLDWPATGASIDALRSLHNDPYPSAVLTLATTPGVAALSPQSLKRQYENDDGNQDGQAPAFFLPPGVVPAGSSQLGSRVTDDTTTAMGPPSRKKAKTNHLRPDRDTTPIAGPGPSTLAIRRSKRLQDSEVRKRSP